MFTKLKKNSYFSTLLEARLNSSVSWQAFLTEKPKTEDVPILAESHSGKRICAAYSAGADRDEHLFRQLGFSVRAASQISLRLWSVRPATSGELDGGNLFRTLFRDV